MSQFPSSHGVLSDAANVHVFSGVYCESLPLAGWTIAKVRRMLAERLAIHIDAIPIIDGSPVEESTVLAPGQTLAFVRRAGEIGER